MDLSNREYQTYEVGATDHGRLRFLLKLTSESTNCVTFLLAESKIEMIITIRIRIVTHYDYSKIRKGCLCDNPRLYLAKNFS